MKKRFVHKQGSDKNELNKKVKHETHVKKEVLPGISQPLKRNLYFLLFILGCGLYINTINHDYVLDDFSIIKENVITTRGIEGIPTLLKTSYRYGYFNISDGLYRPLSVVMFALEWEIWPDDPKPSHIINLLLYGLTGVIGFGFLLRCFPLLNPLVSFLTMVLFLAHPLHTEVVANIKSRDEIICFLFSISVLYIIASDPMRRMAWKFTLMMLLFAGAIFSKETAICILPIAALVLWYKHQSLKTSVIILIPLCIVAGIYLVLRTIILDSTIGIQNISVMDNLLLSAPDYLSRLATAMKILGLYLYKHFIPHPLVFDYSFRSIEISKAMDIKVIASFIVYASAFIYGVKAVIKRDPIGFGIMFYLITLGLFSNLFFLVGTAMAERFAYFSSFGFCFTISYGILKIFSLEKNKEFYTSIKSFFNLSKVPVMILITVSILFSVKTIGRNKYWKDNLTLYSHDVPVQYNSARAHYYLGNEIIKTHAPNEKDPVKKAEWFQKGIKELEKTLEIYPTDQDAHTQLGVAYHRMNEFDKAEKHYNISLKYNPKDVITLNNLAGVYFAKGNFPEAIRVYNSVIEQNPNYYDAWLNSGSAYGMTGQFRLAEERFLKAIEIRPDLPQAYQYLSITYKNLGEINKADQYAEKAKEFSR